MRLVEVALKNFRGYGARTVLSIDDLTVVVGRNDSGKSTFLDALEIVLANGKVDATDIHVHAGTGDELEIECVFDDPPASLTLDSGSETTLRGEYLVDVNGCLRIRWTYAIAGKEQLKTLGKQLVKLVANHPTGSDVADLHSKKNADLKALIKLKGLPANCDQNNNASMRNALWVDAITGNRLQLQLVAIDLSKEDGKTILSQVLSALPMFALFRADRPSTDQDAEVQDPMKTAIRTALAELQEDVDGIKAKVREKALEVANRTLNSLQTFDKSLATSLSPEFADPKLDSAFKLTLMGDDGIAVNKRGSGVRRLVLFSFFQAEAERRQSESAARGIVYGVEEPETAQHPEYQRMVVRSLRQLSEAGGCQVIVTTHSPGLAGLMPAESLRLIENAGVGRSVRSGEDTLSEIVASLGVIPDHRVRLLVCVEGPNDRAFLQSACRAYRNHGEDFVCLDSDPAVAFVLLGGSTLLEWVHGHLLRHTNIPEFHLYDRDVPKYADAAAEVEARGGMHSARQTTKLEMENYLCPVAIARILSVPAGRPFSVSYGDHDDVEQCVAQAIPDANGNPRHRLDRRTLKHWLNHDVAGAMTATEFDAQDSAGEIRGWLADITRIARGQ
jgi:putative ATP-dependent endonuclease of the OLD family